MPITQERAIAIVDAGLFYANLVANARTVIETQTENADIAYAAILENSELTEQQRRAVTTLWEVTKTIGASIETITLPEFEAQKVLIKESAHFSSKSVITHNRAQRRYQKNRRAKIAEQVTDYQLPSSIGNLIKTTPRNNLEQTRQLHELHRRLWGIEEKETWLPSELFDVISATIPKQSGTVILEEMITTKRILQNKTTGKYEIENPAPWEPKTKESKELTDTQEAK